MTAKLVRIDNTKAPNITDNFKYFTYTMDGKLSYMMSISTESDVEEFIIDYYLPRQRYELPTNKW